MAGSAKKGNNRKKSLREDDERTLQSIRRELKPQKRGYSSLSKGKASNCSHEDNRNVRLKVKIVKKAVVCKTKTLKKQPSSTGVKDKLSTFRAKLSKNIDDDRDVKTTKLKRRKRKKTKRKNNVEVDEASRLQRRTRYLLVKMKLEQNLIDAYSTEGWKGQSREKIRPEKELLRARKQILNCKLGIREAIHRLHMLSSEGHISAPDGSIICAKCKLRDALPDNDIILCDGTCNCAFHQECIDPPLSTENIPPGDEGWFCKFCKKKMEILEATNAHLGTQFPMDISWQDVFKEEAALPDGDNTMLCQKEEWPSDDSEDDDYDPDRIEHNCSDSLCGPQSDASDCSSSFLGSLVDESGIVGSFDNSLELIGVDSDEINSDQIVCRPRQRATVDYIELYNEMFGKNATENEQISEEDEDWGPTKKKRKVKENDALSTLMILGETNKNLLDEMPSELKEKQLIEKTKRPIFRLPHNAVEKLRLVFSENELPARDLRLNLSKQLGLEFEKVNKWFKNARYLALKARKQADRGQVSEDGSPSIQNESTSEASKGGHPDQMPLMDNMTSSNLNNPKKIVRRRKTDLTKNSLTLKKNRKPLLQIADSNQMNVDLDADDVSLKHLREKAKEAKKKKPNDKRTRVMVEAEAEMERLCQMKSRVKKLQEVLHELPNQRFRKPSTVQSSDRSVIFVPVAEVREKR